MVQFTTRAKPNSAPADCVLSVLNSIEFRKNYHRALDTADKTPAAQQTTARKIVELYFGLERIASNTPLNSGSFYFAERPIEVEGAYKFLIPGAIKRESIAGPLFLLRQNAKEFDSAILAVVAVRLTLMPVRVNGIISFISYAKTFYLKNDVFSAERATGTALDHFNRAAAEGLRKIKGDAEKGKRSNEISGTVRTLANLRKKLQAQLVDRAKRRISSGRQRPDDNRSGI